MTKPIILDITSKKSHGKEQYIYMNTFITHDVIVSLFLQGVSLETMYKLYGNNTKRCRDILNTYMSLCYEEC